MPEELKIRINNHREIEGKLIYLGAKFSHESYIVNIYFKQPSGEVLKISEGDEGNFLIKLRSKNGGFEILKHEQIDDIQKMKKNLEKFFEVKCILKKRVRYYSFKKYKIGINLIEGVGEFLVIEGESLTPEVITEELNINNPEFVKVSFDQLAK